MAVAPQQERPSEFRRDPYRGEWVIMAPGRASRPQPAMPHTLLDDASPGPFAAGHEEMTPPELLGIRNGGRANDSTWRVRVIPNLYPALRVEQGGPGTAEGPYDRMGGLGAHEVIIEDPSRGADLTTMDVGRVFEVLAAWRARLGDLRRDQRMACAVIFRHRGADAGATIAHPHSQLLTVPVIPPLLQNELAAMARYRAAHARCAVCDAIRHERATTERLVIDGGSVLALAPFASRVPFELLIAPTGHGHAFEDADEATLRQTAWVLKEALQRLDARAGTPPYRMWLRTAPWRGSDEEKYGFHWHLSLLPITSRVGALEEGTGLRINTLLPEEAAQLLRS